jgi:dTDP-glucose 4,6-dehydratase
VKTLLVTGGAGFIGSALVRMLIRDAGYRVVTVDKLTYAGNLESLEEVLDAPNHRFVQADIADATAMRAVFEEAQPDGVIHLAAESHDARSHDGPGEFTHTNLVRTITL